MYASIKFTVKNNISRNETNDKQLSLKLWNIISLKWWTFQDGDATSNHVTRTTGATDLFLVPCCTKAKKRTKMVTN